MSRKRVLVVAVLVMAMAMMVAAQATAGMGGACGTMGGSMGRGAKPVFTEKQQVKMKEIRGGFEGERVELANRIKVMHLEMGEVLAGGDPDFGKLGRMIDEIAGVRAEMIKIWIRQHVAVRKILTDDQRVLFDEGFGAKIGQCLGGAGAIDCKPGGRMMGGRGGGGGAMCGSGNTPRCPPGAEMMCLPGGAAPHPPAAPGRTGI